ncbi:hypothetical protein SDC9_156363 [bioreactor metagenome]|uniref:Uncharacterized protein n=1 Tax=bioreactor metagenome TaxID=1076179 RepID=A0A645F419_9ZZZZ
MCPDGIIEGQHLYKFESDFFCPVDEQFHIAKIAYAKTFLRTDTEYRQAHAGTPPAIGIHPDKSVVLEYPGFFIIRHISRTIRSLFEATELMIFQIIESVFIMYFAGAIRQIHHQLPFC